MKDNNEYSINIFIMNTESFTECSEETRELILRYLASMNEKEKIAYEIAKDHLGTSFNIVKSIGYMEWKAKNLAT